LRNEPNSPLHPRSRAGTSSPGPWPPTPNPRPPAFFGDNEA
jgi:hypothetical protein